MALSRLSWEEHWQTQANQEGLRPFEECPDLDLQDLCFQLEGQDYNEMRGKTDYHLQSIHAARYQEILVFHSRTPQKFGSFQCP